MATVFFQEGSQYIPHTGKLTTRAVLSAAKRAGNGRYAIIWWQTEKPDIYERMVREFTPVDKMVPGETYVWIDKAGVNLKIDLRGTGELRHLNHNRLISSIAVVKDSQDD